MSEYLMHLHFLLLLFLCCVSPSSLFLVDDLVACLPDQIQALTQFKNEFDTRRCKRSDSYIGRVICDYSTGAITTLIIRACLSGTLMPNSSLFKLHHLRYLNLSGNNFISSSLPSELGNLNRLEVLSLSSNGFIGQVPSSFSNLSQLNYLDLSHNKLTGSFPFLRNQKLLTVLHLSDNHFSGILNPNSSLFQFHHLQYLSLEGNKFISSSLPYEFGNLNKLEVLSLSSNGFLGQVPSSFSNLSKLTYLGLSKNELTGSFPFLRNLSLLTSLDISDNHFSGILNPNSSLFELHQLQYLNLSDNNFIPSSLWKSKQVKCLVFSSNGFLGQVPSSFSNLSQLTYLELSNNKLTGSFPLLRNLSMLESLDLSQNHFSGVLNSNSSLFELHQLRYLDLAFNSFSSSLPSEFGNLNKLETLSLDSNGFFGQVPPTISNLTQLTGLYLSDNRFTVSRPCTLGNHFEGKILEPISKLTNLKQLDLSYINTSYPIDLNLFSSFKSLFHLDISGHNISPASLSSDSYIPLALEVLFLMHCDIKEFPDFLKTLQNLEVLNMLGNGMNGKILSGYGVFLV
ncbi:unnamed protein product [Microthlaspi erraticum]|uniref:Disease resistance R13L4/SHOC-2-like LRR domain-containing protein n=1 Tax=Microthlaspi erraticum TaxID=1685480 RepID=A0A6D2KJV4_9BRAS|nr:unnamed protein product [Microthlaspi erraticum]